MEEMIISLLKVLCPHLKDMAARTATPVDDVVVNIICMIAGAEPTEKK